MEKFGLLVVYLKFDEFLELKVGYFREEIEFMIIDERMFFYRFVVEVYGEDEKRVEVDIKKVFMYEGCRINKFVM